MHLRRLVSNSGAQHLAEILLRDTRYPAGLGTGLTHPLTVEALHRQDRLVAKGGDFSAGHRQAEFAQQLRAQRLGTARQEFEMGIG